MLGFYCATSTRSQKPYPLSQATASTIASCMASPAASGVSKPSKKRSWVGQNAVVLSLKVLKLQKTHQRMGVHQVSSSKLSYVKTDINCKPVIACEVNKRSVSTGIWLCKVCHILGVARNNANTFWKKTVYIQR